jgi:hypothetical protein
MKISLGELFIIDKEDAIEIGYSQIGESFVPVTIM